MRQLQPTPTQRPAGPLRHAPRTVRVLVRALALALGLVLLVATPAGADPAGPSDFRSEVTAIEPDVEGLDAVVVGGDSFLELSVDPGHTAVVAGYSGEPYLRFHADGVVEQNLRSPATYLNEDRTGEVSLPADADADVDPDWEQVADDGTYAWHDHRIHWMDSAAPSVERGEAVPGAYDPWRVPVTFDGTPVEVQGVLTYEEEPLLLPWIAVAVLAAGGLAWLGRGVPVRAAAASLAIVAGIAAVVGRADFGATPDGQGDALLWVLPAVALGCAVVALVLARRSAGAVAALASVAALSGWALLRLAVLVEPVLPATVPAPLDRAAVALALGAAAGAAYLLVTSGVLSLPELEDDE